MSRRAQAKGWQVRGKHSSAHRRQSYLLRSTHMNFLMRAHTPRGAGEGRQIEETEGERQQEREVGKGGRQAGKHACMHAGRQAGR